ncbi:MAG: hypothetical protein WCH43_10525, partial [Verrucomicrobiota bacterium]
MKTLKTLSAASVSLRLAFIGSRPKFLFILLALLGTVAASRATDWNPAPGTWINTPIVITNNTGQYDDSQIWVAFNNGIASTATPQTYGTNSFGATGNLQYGSFQTADWQYAPLSDFKVTNPDIPALSGSSAYMINLNDYTGRIYVSYGSALTAVPLNSGTTPYVMFEPYIVGQVNQTATAGSNIFIPTTASNIDLSYVDGISAAANTYIRSGSGTILAATTMNPILTNSNIMATVAAAVPSGALVTSSTNGPVIRILSGSNAPDGTYHDWNSLMNHLQTSGSGTLNIGSYTSPNDPTNLQQYGLTNTLFGYGQTGAISGQAPNFQNAQGYSATALFSSTNLVISGSGIQNSGGPAASGSFSIIISRSVLNANTGIYGENPAYTVITSATTYTTAGIVNDFGGRVVGDVLAGMVFGWAGSTVNIAAHAAATGLNLHGVTFSSTTVGGLTTGEYFYLISLAAAQGKVTDWIGAGVTDNPLFYDIYNYAIAQASGAYGSGFGDRFQGIYNPGTTWYTSYPPADPLSTDTPPADFQTVGYVQLDLLPTTFSSVPEPSSSVLLLMGGLVMMVTISAKLSLYCLAVVPV